jgi:hypothetical protein
LARSLLNLVERNAASLTLCRSLNASAVGECGELDREVPEVTVTPDASEAVFGFAEGQGGPAKSPVATAPMFHVASDAADGAEGVLDRIGAGEEPLKNLWDNAPLAVQALWRLLHGR